MGSIEQMTQGGGDGYGRLWLKDQYEWDEWTNLMNVDGEKGLWRMGRMGEFGEC
jgi:hypothetical protein